MSIQQCTRYQSRPVQRAHVGMEPSKISQTRCKRHNTFTHLVPFCQLCFVLVVCIGELWKARLLVSWNLTTQIYTGITDSLSTAGKELVRKKRAVLCRRAKRKQAKAVAERRFLSSGQSTWLVHACGWLYYYSDSWSTWIQSKLVVCILGMILAAG